MASFSLTQSNRIYLFHIGAAVDIALAGRGEYIPIVRPGLIEGPVEFGINITHQVMRMGWEDPRSI